MKPEFLAFNTVCDNAIIDKMQCSRIIALGVAVALANSAPVPTSQVENPASHYVSNVLASVRTQLSCINENVVFDCKAALEQVRSLWLLRYTAAHPTSRPIYSTSGSFFENLIGVGSFVAPELVEFANTHKQSVLLVAMAAGELLEKMRLANG